LRKLAREEKAQRRIEKHVRKEKNEGPEESSSRTGPISLSKDSGNPEKEKRKKKRLEVAADSQPSLEGEKISKSRRPHPPETAIDTTTSLVPIVSAIEIELASSQVAVKKKKRKRTDKDLLV